jgi:hypothetical protein
MCLEPITINSKKPKYIRGRWTQQIPVSCGKCRLCKITKVRQWCFRLLKEESKSLSSYFITLTYDIKNVPMARSGYMTLDHGYMTEKGHFSDDLNRFIKNLRYYDKQIWKKHGHKVKYKKKIKYYAVGEYGEKTNRPHYHAIVLNLYSVGSIEKAWKKGLFHVGQVTGNSIAYTMKYIDKDKKVPKHSGDDRRPEFAYMSKKLGDSYLTEEMKKYHKADLKRYYVESNGYKVRMPKYYADKIYTDKEKKKISKLVEEYKEEKELQLEKEMRKLYGDRMTIFEYKLALGLAQETKFKKSAKRRDKI